MRATNEQLRPISKNTVKAYRQIPKAIEPLVDMPVSTLGQEWLIWCVAAMNDAQMKSTAIRLRVTVLTQFMQQVAGLRFVADGGVVVAPNVELQRRRLPYFDGRRPEYAPAPSDEVIRDLLRFTRMQGAAGAVIAGMIFTGRRVEQMTMLEGQQIQETPHLACHGVIHWRADQNKAGLDDDISYLPREILSYWPEVKPGRMFNVSVDMVAKSLAIFSEARDLDHKLTPHSLRAWFITKHHLEGRPLRMIADLVGQKSIATTAGYIRRVPKKDLAPVAAAFGAALLDQGKNIADDPWFVNEWWKA